MVFYAYISENKGDSVWRIVMAFADSSKADEWWRTVSGSNNNLLANIRRITPEKYIHNTAVFNMINFFTDSRIADISQPFESRLILSLQNDHGGKGITVFPHQKAIDVRLKKLNSGGAVTHGAVIHAVDRFYIRSSVDPELYWFQTKYNYPDIVASRTEQSLFCVTAANVSAGTVMIRSDTVTLSTQSSKNIILTPHGTMTRGDDPWSFTFGDLAAGRFVGSVGNLVSFNVNNDGVKRPGWELVN